jgi:hypothetical protein
MNINYKLQKLLMRKKEFNNNKDKAWKISLSSKKMVFLNKIAKKLSKLLKNIKIR